MFYLVISSARLKFWKYSLEFKKQLWFTIYTERIMLEYFKVQMWKYWNDIQKNMEKCTVENFVNLDCKSKTFLGAHKLVVEIILV